MSELRSGEAVVTLSPKLGASLTRYALADGREILRPSPDASDGLGCACYLLAPWCNRIAGGVTLPDGRFHPVAPTHPAHPLPIHGSAALAEWEVVAQAPSSMTLRAEIDWPAPFHYAAEVTWALTGAALSVELTVTHLGAEPLPHGLGIHPWFRRTAHTRLQANALRWQRTDARMLPVADVSLAERPDWDFGALRPLPEGLIDTAFGGWYGTARLEIEPGLALDIATEPALSQFQVYSTGTEADFVCFEPVTHPINAHNVPGHPGLALLRTGEQCRLKVTVAPDLSAR